MIPIILNMGGIRNYLEMILDRHSEPEAMSSDLRADIMRGIVEKISNMSVGPFRISTLSMVYAYQ